MHTTTPRITIAALRGGSGKTIVSLGLTAAWKLRHKNILVLESEDYAGGRAIAGEFDAPSVGRSVAHPSRPLHESRSIAGGRLGPQGVSQYPTPSSLVSQRARAVGDSRRVPVAGGRRAA